MLRTFLYVLSNLNIESYRASKKGNNEGTIRSKSKYNNMKSSKISNKEVEIRKIKKENTQDIISKSILNHFMFKVELYKYY